MVETAQVDQINSDIVDYHIDNNKKYMTNQEILIALLIIILTNVTHAVSLTHD
jgi:hypothetical protein